MGGLFYVLILCVFYFSHLLEIVELAIIFIFADS